MSYALKKQVAVKTRRRAERGHSQEELAKKAELAARFSLLLKARLNVLET